MTTPVKYHDGHFPPAALDWERLLPLIGPAHAAVARYEGTLRGIPNAQVLLSPLTSQEAVLSSKIEGTQATLGEVLEFEAAEETASGEKRIDIQEVLNYRKAMRHAVLALKKLPLSQRVVRDTHRVLLAGVRGENRTPGEYRRGPNWIGEPGCKAETARFVPPGADRVLDLMSSWEKYLHEQVPDRLVQLAILHAEFEAIHPFLDGNGRLGRLLVPLFMVDKQLLSSPDFYISGYLESRRDDYYDRLLAVSRDDDWTGWCVFFLEALTAQARDNEARAMTILKLYQSKKDWIAEQTHSQYAVRALDWFFNRPIFKTSDFVASAGIPKPTANRIVRVVREAKLLRELRPASGRRAALLIFPELLNIAEGRTVF
jgi:Fic family protein